MIHVALAAGHTARHPGALAVDGTHEHGWCSVLAHKLHASLAVLGVKSAVFGRPDGAYDAAMRRLCSTVNRVEPRLVLELHFDSSAGRGWDGSAGLHWPTSQAGRSAARLLSVAAAHSIGTRDRGAIAQTRSWERSRIVDGRHVPDGRELRILQWTAAPAVILETHYGDTEADHVAATAARDSGRLAAALARGVVRALEEL